MKHSKKGAIGAVLLAPLLVAGCGGGSSGGGPPAAQVPVEQAPPTIASLTPQTMDENAVLGPIALAVGDAETPAGALTVNGRAADSALLPDDGVEISGTGKDRTLFLIPAAGRSGTTDVTLAVADASGARTTTTFSVAVEPLFPGEFSGWMRGVVATRNLFDEAVGELNEDGTPLTGPEDIPRIAFSDNSADDPAAYDDLLPADGVVPEDD